MCGLSGPNTLVSVFSQVSLRVGGRGGEACLLGYAYFLRAPDYITFVLGHYMCICALPFFSFFPLCVTALIFAEIRVLLM